MPLEEERALMHRVERLERNIHGENGAYKGLLERVADNEGDIEALADVRLAEIQSSLRELKEKAEATERERAARLRKEAAEAKEKAQERKERRRLAWGVVVSVATALILAALNLLVNLLQTVAAGAA